MKQQLLDGGEELVGGEIVFARGRAAQHAHVQHDDFRLSALGAPQGCLQRIERVVGAHGHEDVARLHAHIFRRQVGRLREIEFVELGVGFGRALGDIFGNFENDEEDNREGDAGNRGDLFGEEIDDSTAQTGRG